MFMKIGAKFLLQKNITGDLKPIMIQIRGSIPKMVIRWPSHSRDDSGWWKWSSYCCAFHVMWKWSMIAMTGWWWMVAINLAFSHEYWVSIIIPIDDSSYFSEGWPNHQPDEHDFSIISFLHSLRETHQQFIEAGVNNFADLFGLVIQKNRFKPTWNGMTIHIYI